MDAITTEQQPILMEAVGLEIQPRSVEQQVCKRRLPEPSSNSVVDGKKRSCKGHPRWLLTKNKPVELTGEGSSNVAKVFPRQVRRGNNKKYKKRFFNQTTAMPPTQVKSGGQGVKKRGPRRLSGSNHAPFNSTQFLMNDRGSESIRYLDDKLDVQRGSASAPEDSVDEERFASHAFARRQVSRARESSFSLDSDEDYYYSSPEDEEEFVNREFIKDYNMVRTDRLVDMSKSELINEYLQMEQRIDALEKRLARFRGGRTTTTQVDSAPPSPPPINADLSGKILAFQSEIRRLEQENETLRRQNSNLPEEAICEDSIVGHHDDDDDDDMCSTCSSSSSTSSSTSSSSSSEDEGAQEIDDPQMSTSGDSPMVESTAEASNSKVAACEIANIEDEDEPKEVQDDTGYESGQSGHIAKVISENAVSSTDPS